MRIIVVGAGVLGTSCAYHLVGAGVSVVLVDRADEGRATSAGAGIVSPWSSRISDPAAYALLGGGARYYPELVAALAEDGEHEVGYRRVGALIAPDDASELDAAERRVRARVAEAPEAGAVSRLSAAEAKRLFPPLRHDLPALHVAGGARVNGRLLAAALSRAAATRGARLIEGDAELVLRSGRAAGVRVGTETIEGDAVVVAAGAWASAFLAPAGVTLPVVPQRGQIIHLRNPGLDTRHWPTVQPLGSHYLLAFDDSRVVIGATREDGAGFDYRLTAGGVAEVLNAGLATAPGLNDWTLHEMRIGFRPMAARPLLGPARNVPNLLIGNGLGPSGLTIGPFAGALLAAAALGCAPALPLRPV